MKHEKLWLLWACSPTLPAGCLLQTCHAAPAPSHLTDSDPVSAAFVATLAMGFLVTAAWSDGRWNSWSLLVAAETDSERLTHACLRAFALTVPGTQNALLQDGRPTISLFVQISALMSRSHCAHSHHSSFGCDPLFPSWFLFLPHA